MAKLYPRWRFMQIIELGLTGAVISGTCDIFTDKFRTLRIRLIADRQLN